jgi:hypothetical protein
MTGMKTDEQRKTKTWNQKFVYPQVVNKKEEQKTEKDTKPK